MKLFPGNRSSTEVVPFAGTSSFEPIPQHIDRAVVERPSSRRRSYMPTVRIGSIDPMARFEGRVPNTPESPDWRIMREWHRAVAHSRYAAQTNAQAQKFLFLLEDNVPGPGGFQLQAQVTQRRGNKLDTELNDALESAYAEFSKAANFDHRGELSRPAFERMAIRQAATDGECFGVAIYGDEAGPYGFAYRLVDASLLEPDYNRETLLGTSNFIKHGIEFSRSGRRVAYHFRQPDDSRIGYMVANSGHKYLRVPAEDVDHIYRPWAIGAERGWPWMASVTSQMHQTTAYEEAAVTRARVSASEGGFIEVDPDYAPPPDEDEPEFYDLELEPGVIRELPPGRRYSSHNSAYPAGEFQVFIKHMIRSMASALNVSYASLANDLESVNFSSIRHGALEERESYKRLQAWLIERLAVRQYNRWLSYALLAGKIRVRGQEVSPAERTRCESVQFLGRRWDWVDPLKDIEAIKQEIGLGIRSRTATMRERGRDPESVWQEIQRENEQMEKYGVTPVEMPPAPKVDEPLPAKNEA